VTLPKTATLGASALVSALRVVLGVLWLHEGLFKYKAGFGRADILLVAHSVQTNDRVPGFFLWFSNHTLLKDPGLFGFGIPLIETCLGLALILGLGTRPVAFISLFELFTYWCSDQLITQYPVMLILSAIVLLLPMLASRLSVATLGIALINRRWPAVGARVEPFRAWL
jgi:thiosulfate dehydrogenase [quinone] large subunit